MDTAIEDTAPEAQRRLLGAWLAKPATFFATQSTIREADFAGDWHKAVYRAIAEAAGNGEVFDAVTVGSSLLTVREDAIADLAAAQRDCLCPDNAEAYASIVRANSRVRLKGEALYRAMAAFQAGDLDALAALPQELEQADARSGGYGDFRAVLSSALARSDEVANARASGGYGARFNVPALDSVTGGLYGPRLYVLAARPGIGKTALAMQMALYSADRGIGVGYCSLEMGAEELGQRAIAHKLGVNLKHIVRGDDAGRDRLRLNWRDRGRALEELPVYVDDSSFALREITARIMEWKRKHDIGIAVVDHLQLVTGAGGENRNRELGRITSTLKRLAKQLDMPILVLCQLNRQVERESRKPTMSDLRDSGEIEQDADTIIALHGTGELRDFSFRGEPVEYREVLIGLLKNRTGIADWLFSPFRFVGAYQQFVEVGDYAVAAA